MSTSSIDLQVTGIVIGQFKADHVIKIPASMKSKAMELGHEFLLRQYGKKVCDDMVDITTRFPEPEKKKEQAVTS